MKELPKILAVDDDEQILKQLKWALSEEYDIFLAQDRPGALEVFEEEDIQVVLLDLGLPPSPREATEGLRALEEMMSSNPCAKIVIVSGNSERRNAISAVERGAHDIFPKPLDIDQLKVVLERIWKRIRLEEESFRARREESEDAFSRIVGSSASMQAVLATVQKVARTDVPVLLLGESGTGKELVATALHRLSERSKGPFIAINCAAIPETLLESELFGHEKGAFTGANRQQKGRLEFAQGGTLFLDEVGDLAPELQVKLLRFFQEKVIERVGGRESIPIDCRVVAATHQDLKKAVAESRFREDLYFRLAVVKISLPRLSEREDDVIEIAEHFCVEFAKELHQPQKKLSAEALDAIRHHDWPGNVRELQNRLKRALVLADGPVIGPEELELSEADRKEEISTLKEARVELEKDLIARALRENNGNISRTAKALGISRPTLYDLMSRYGI